MARKTGGRKGRKLKPSHKAKISRSLKAHHRKFGRRRRFGRQPKKKGIYIGGPEWNRMSGEGRRAVNQGYHRHYELKPDYRRRG